jgi:signal peptidase I
VVEPRAEINPYATVPSSRAVGEARPTPLWPAIVVSLLAYPFAGAGVLLQRLSAARLLCFAASVALLVAHAFTPPGPAPVVRVAYFASYLLWIVGIVVTCVGQPRTVSSWWRILIPAVSALLVVKVGLKLFVVESFQLPSGSMLPNLAIGDRLFSSKLLLTPSRGDVIVFDFPPRPEIKYMKRVIGLSGETVEIRGNQVIIDGQPLPRQLLSVPCGAGAGDAGCEVWEELAGRHAYRVFQTPGRRADFPPTRVPADAFFVLGDNRDNSSDSRVWGTVARSLVKGRATFIWYSGAPEGAVAWSRIGKAIE